MLSLEIGELIYFFFYGEVLDLGDDYVVDVIYVLFVNFIIEEDGVMVIVCVDLFVFVECFGD